MTMQAFEPIHETGAETGRRIRKELKARYPLTSFFVQTRTTSMGTSVTVTFTNGLEPDHDEIRERLHRFKSATYDGMTYSGADYIFYRER